MALTRKTLNSRGISQKLNHQGGDMRGSFRSIIKISLRQVFEHTQLLALGVFASLTLHTALFELSSKRIVSLFTQGNFLTHFAQMVQDGPIRSLFEPNLLGLPFSYFDSPVKFICIAALIVAALYLAITSQIGIVRSVRNGAKETAGKALHEAHTYFIEGITLYVITRLAIALVFLLCTLPIFYALISGNPVSIGLTTFIFAPLFFFAFIAIVITSQFTLCVIALNNHSLVDALKVGWSTFLHNKLLSVEIAIYTFFLRLVSYLVFLIITGVLTFPLGIILWLLFTLGNSILFGLFLTLTIVLGIALFIGMNAAYTAIYYASYTNLFLAVQEHSLKSKIERLINRILGIKEKGFSMASMAGKKAQKIRPEFESLINELLMESKPAVKKFAKKVETQIERYEPELKKIEKAARATTREVIAESAPVVRKVGKQIIKDSKLMAAQAKPQAKKALAKLADELEDLTPAIESLKSEIKKTITKAVKVKKSPAKKTVKKKRS